MDIMQSYLVTTVLIIIAVVYKAFLFYKNNNNNDSVEIDHTNWLYRLFGVHDGFALHFVVLSQRGL